MRLEWSIEQLFLRPKGADFEVLMVVVSPAGARFRETTRSPGRDARAAVQTAARYLAGRGQVTEAARLRVRVERGGRLDDAPELAHAFREAFAAASGS